MSHITWAVEGTKWSDMACSRGVAHRLGLCRWSLPRRAGARRTSVPQPPYVAPEDFPDVAVVGQPSRRAVAPTPYGSLDCFPHSGWTESTGARMEKWCEKRW